MGPERGTSEYIEQVETIVTVIGDAAETTAEVNQMAMLYIMDRNFSRAAICEALKRIERSLGKQPEKLP